MKIGFVLFENYLQRKNIGSSRIRGKWVIKYLNRIPGVEAEEFIQGKLYDVIVFQKVYWKEMAKAFNGIKILDICDPDWLDGAEIVNFAEYVDFITCPTEALAENLKNMTEKPVYIIPDGEDLEVLPPPKTHEGIAKKIVWFGYSHNISVLDPTYYKIKTMGLILKVISDANLNTQECRVENVKWDIESVDKEIQEADFALLPDRSDGRFKFKSNNKTIHSWALGLPVAKNPKDMERFMDPKERREEALARYQEVREKFSVESSANSLYKLIQEYQKPKDNQEV